MSSEAASLTSGIGAEAMRGAVASIDSPVLRGTLGCVPVSGGVSRSSWRRASSSCRAASRSCDSATFGSSSGRRRPTINAATARSAPSAQAIPCGPVVPRSACSAASAEDAWLQSHHPSARRSARAPQRPAGSTTCSSFSRPARLGKPAGSEAAQTALPSESASGLRARAAKAFTEAASRRFTRKTTAPVPGTCAAAARTGLPSPSRRTALAAPDWRAPETSDAGGAMGTEPTRASSDSEPKTRPVAAKSARCDFHQSSCSSPSRMVARSGSRARLAICWMAAAAPAVDLRSASNEARASEAAPAASWERRAASSRAEATAASRMRFAATEAPASEATATISATTRRPVDPFPTATATPE
ncbi:MAG: hypothetical protein QM765_06420 [Myxococcales bacterium]